MLVRPGRMAGRAALLRNAMPAGHTGHACPLRSPGRIVTG
jgi:hypothetical protein